MDYVLLLSIRHYFVYNRLNKMMAYLKSSKVQIIMKYQGEHYNV